MRQLSRATSLAALVMSVVALGGAAKASATMLEIAGVSQEEAVPITLSYAGMAVTSFTGGTLYDVCSASHASGSIQGPGGGEVTGALTALSYSGCSEAVTVHKPGKLYIEHISGTTNGTVFSEETEVTQPIPQWGITVSCRTSAGTDIGILKGVKEGHATIDISAILNCGFILPSTEWRAQYRVTSPTGLGVVKTPPPSQPTTLEVSGTKKNESVSVQASLASGNSSVLSRTDGSLANTCTSSIIEGSSGSPYTETKVTGAISALSWTNCSDGDPTVHKKGQLYVEHESGTTNGNVFSENAEVTVPTALGFTVNCKTGEGTKVGTVTGVKEGNGTMHVNAVLNCGFLLPSASWKGTYTVTSPSGLGVSA